MCRGYFKNPSGKCEVISGEKCVISLHEDSVGAESAIQGEEFNVPVCSLWQCWCGWTGTHLGSNSPGTCHGHIPCARTPCLHHACLIPLLLQRSSELRFSHFHQTASLPLCTLLPQKSEGLFIIWQQKKRWFGIKDALLQSGKQDSSFLEVL